jgi:transcriptional regulator with XRE-family HTH domain
MASKKLPNYLRANRKRLGLTQKQVSYLLGAEGSAKTCRYERFNREPGFETALACEAAFQRPASELFAGAFQRIEHEVAERAAQLIVELDRMKPNPQRARQRAALTAIAAKGPKRQGKSL